MSVEVYDIETLSNCFTYTGVDVNTGKVSQFVIHESRDDSGEFISHMDSLKGMIGFNNIGFDYPVIHWFYNSFFKWIREAKTGFVHDYTAEQVAEQIYVKVQEIINTPEDKKFSVQIPEWKFLVPQLDLYKINHFDNNARRTSLKDLEFWMRYPKVQDMPIKHGDRIEAHQIGEILDYNLNDVLATLEFYKLNRGKIDLRKQLCKQYNLRLINANDTKIGSDIFLDLLSQDMQIEKKELRYMRTKRDSINLSECILPFIKFKSPEFTKLLNDFKSTVVVETKGALEKSVIYNGFKYDYGLGGIHGCIKTGTYSEDTGKMIIDADVASLYPSIGAVYKFCPEHLGESFTKIYSDMIHQRLEAKKSGNKVMSEGLKLALNGVYGKSNDEKSFLYDPKYTMSITINGQLLLTMLAEALVLAIPSIEMLQINTDGLTVKMSRCHRSIYDRICTEWQEITKLTLEFVEYKKMVISDVNNYMAVKTSGEVKYKGLFEIEKEFHKDTSFKIIQIALSRYFLNGVPVKETIRQHKDIYDFCGRAKFKSDSYGEIHYLGYDHRNAPVEIKEKQQKTVRYYISNVGATFMKVFPTKNKSNVINSGYMVSIFNNYVELDNYDINHTFYVNECNKIIQSIESKQLTLL